MAMKPVDRNIKVVFGPAIDDADFKTREEVIPFDAAGMEIDVIVEAADGTVTHTAVVPTDTGGDYDWTAADQGYYELELPASSGLSFNNDTLGILTVVVYVTGVMPLRSVAYDVVPGNVYEAMVEGTAPLFIPEDPNAEALMYGVYGTVAEADAYFSMRLHEYAWTAAMADDHLKALWAATLIIDALNFKGDKNAVYALLEADSAATDEEIRTAEASQPLEFPRGADTSVPDMIRKATYEIAHSLLDGKDPELELENLGIVSQGFGSVRTTYNRSQIPIEHIINGIPSAQAWRFLRPFLRDDEAIKLARV